MSELIGDDVRVTIETNYGKVTIDRNAVTIYQYASMLRDALLATGFAESLVDEVIDPEVVDYV